MDLPDKQEVIDYITEVVETTLKQTKAAFERSRQDSIEAESRMQSRYDTQGIEAAYLADAFAMKIPNLKKQLYVISTLKIPNNNGTIGLCSIVGIKEMESNKASNYIIMPAGGGEEIKYKGICFTVLTPHAPRGFAMIGKQEGDTFKLEIDNKNIEYMIEQVA